MSLLPYVDKEIDECRGLEYLRRNSSREIFHRILAHTWTGLKEARKIHPRGELIVRISFESALMLEDEKRVVRINVVSAPPTLKQFKSENHSTFLAMLDKEGYVIGVYKDTLSITG